MSHFSGQGRKDVPIGHLGSDLSTLAAIAINRIRNARVTDWLMWNDTHGDIYLSDFNSRAAQEVMLKNPQLRICNYRFTRLYKIKGADILDDLQDAAARLFVRDSLKEAA